MLVLYGDVPLIASGTLRALVDRRGAGRWRCSPRSVDHPKGYGRIVRDAARPVARIVEEKDATDAERAHPRGEHRHPRLAARSLEAWLARLRNDNAQGEYYLTDVVAAAVADGTPSRCAIPRSPTSASA